MTGWSRITWNGETVVDVPPRTVAHEGPIYQRPVARPDWQDELNADTSAALARVPESCAHLRCACRQPAPVQPRLHHRAVRPVRAGQHRAGRARRRRRAADRRDHRSRHRGLDRRLGALHQARPYRGHSSRLAEACTATSPSTGATPIAVTNCLNFGSPEDPGVMWQFSQAVRGLADGCAALGIPVTGGNVSFYNQTGSTPILPTPVVGVARVIDDVSRGCPPVWAGEPGEPCCCSATPTTSSTVRSGRAGHRRSSRRPAAAGGPGAREAAGRGADRRHRDGLVSAAHDLSEGGLIQAVVEAALPVKPVAASCFPERGPVRLPLLPNRRPGIGRRAAHRGEPIPVDVRGPRAARDASVSPTTARIR